MAASLGITEREGEGEEEAQRNEGTGNAIGGYIQETTLKGKNRRGCRKCNYKLSKGHSNK